MTPYESVVQPAYRLCLTPLVRIRRYTMTLLLSAVTVFLLTELVNLRIIPSPEFGHSLHNPERSEAFRSNELTVGTYNIRYGKGLDEAPSLHQIAEVLSTPRLDVIGMNEVRMEPFSSENQAEKLAGILDMSWIYAMTENRYLSRRPGNAVLSRYHIKHYEIVPLFQARTDLEEVIETNSRRNYIFVLLDNGETEVAVIATHIDRGAMLPLQVEQVLKRFEQYDHAILMGDMNTIYSQPEISQRLAAGALNAITAGHDYERPHIDWILTRGFEVLESGHHPLGISDHPQYWAKLRIADDTQRVATAL